MHFEFYVDLNEGQANKKLEATLSPKDNMDVEGEISEKSKRDLETAGDQKLEPGQKILHVPNLHTFSESNVDMLRLLVTKYNIPEKYHFPLLVRIRLARAFPDLAARRDFIRINLLSFIVLAQVHMDLGALSSFFLYEPEFISELMALVRSDHSVPQDFRVLSLDALSALTADRSRLPKVISATGCTQHHGEIPSMIRKSVATLTGSVEHPIYTLPFIESLFSFLSSLMATPDGIAALNTAGVISTLLPLLRHTNPEHFPILLQCLSILEYYIAGNSSNTAISLFRDLGGLELLTDRFNMEIEQIQKQREAEITLDTADKGKEKENEESTSSSILDKTMRLEGDELPHEHIGQLPHNQRTLLKIVLRVLLPFIQGGGRHNFTRLIGVTESAFPKSLKYVLDNYQYFGDRIFSFGTLSFICRQKNSNEILFLLLLIYHLP